MRYVCVLVALAVGLLGPLVPSVQAATRVFPETGWRVEGRMLDYWQANNGLALFGLPLGPQRDEPTADGRFATQMFERNRLELHPENAAPYDVLLGRLGEELLRRQGRDWRNEAMGEQMIGPCRTFEVTGRSVCGVFLSYWQSYGLDLGDPDVSENERLALFGLPLTAPQIETNSSGDRVLTQWFERARFEYHPSNPPQYQVLLGRLGAELAGEPAPLPDLPVDITPSAVPQGHTFVVRVQSNSTVAVRGTLDNAMLAFSSDGVGGWIALGGVPVLAAAGTLPLHIEVDLPDGRAVVRDLQLTVRDAGYAVENINLPPDVQARLEQNQAQIAAERALVNAIWPQVTPEKLWNGAFILPAEGRISSAFGTKRSYNGGPVDSFHEGLDIANATGTPVIAPARGRVVLAEPDLLVRGGAVILDHGQGVHTGFWHMSQVIAQPGQIVEQGDLIGRIGAKGMVTGPHLHWDVRIGMVNVSPLEWIERSWP